MRNWKVGEHILEATGLKDAEISRISTFNYTISSSQDIKFSSSVYFTDRFCLSLQFCRTLPKLAINDPPMTRIRSNQEDNIFPPRQ